MFITNQLNIDEATAEHLKTYMENGGVVISDGQFGMISDTGLVHTRLPGGPMNSLLGGRLIDADPEALGIEVNWPGHSPFTLDGYYEKKLLDTSGYNAEIMARFQDGNAAVLKSKYGKGEFIYVSTFLWYGYFKNNSISVQSFINLLNNQYGLALHSTDDNRLKLCTMKSSEQLILFAFNYLNQELTADITVNDLEWPSCRVKNLYKGEETVLEVKDCRAILKVTSGPRDVSIFVIRKA